MVSKVVIIELQRCFGLRKRKGGV